MKNVRISNKQMETLQFVGLFPTQSEKIQLCKVWGFPVFKIENGWIIFSRCEYCGLPTCKCGAPKDNQGVIVEDLYTNANTIIYKILSYLKMP